MPKVVILEPLGDDLDTSSLEEYGKLTVMFDHRGPRCPSVFHTDDFMSAVSEWLEENFDPEEDYFVVAGRMTKATFAVLALYQSFHHGFTTRVLIYDGSKKSYVQRSI